MSTQLVLPRFVNFKSDNERFITHRNAEDLNIDGQEFDQGRGAVHEIFHEGQDIVSIRSVQNGRFWRHVEREWTSNQIQASGLTRPAANDRDGRFRVFLFSPGTVALMSMGNQRYCRRFTRLGTDKFRAIDETVAPVFGRLVVEEPVTSRHLENIVYDLQNVSITGQRPLMIAEVQKTNNTSNLLTDLEVTVSYEVHNTASWSNSVTIGQSLSITVSAGVPFVSGAGVSAEVSASTTRSTEWGASTTTSTTVSSTLIVRDVPPGASVTVSVVGSEANVSVPFTYVQRDTWTSGHTQTVTHTDGIFHGVNSFNIRHEAFNSATRAPYTVQVAA